MINYEVGVIFEENDDGGYTYEFSMLEEGEPTDRYDMVIFNEEGTNWSKYPMNDEISEPYDMWVYQRKNNPGVSNEALARVNILMSVNVYATLGDGDSITEAYTTRLDDLEIVEYLARSGNAYLVILPGYRKAVISLPVSEGKLSDLLPVKGLPNADLSWAFGSK